MPGAGVQGAEGALLAHGRKKSPSAGRGFGKPCRIRLRIAGEEKTVMNRLKHLDGVTGAEALPAAEAGVTEARITTDRGGDTGAALDRIFRRLADSGLAVRMMKEERESLEEIFLRATGDRRAE